MARAAGLFPILLLVAALAPFGLGVLLASASGFPPQRPVLVAETLAVVALFLAALAAREAYAPQVGRWPSWSALDRETWARLAYVCLIVGGGLAILLQWVGQTGDFTLPLAALPLAPVIRRQLEGIFCYRARRISASHISRGWSNRRR